MKEATKRGLKNIKTTPQALDAMLEKQAVKVFLNNKVMTEREIHARYEIQLETYTKKIQIESRVMGDIALNHIIPCAIKYQNTLIQNVTGLKGLFSAAEFKKIGTTQLEMIEEISEHISMIKKHVEAMVEERKKANLFESAKKQAIAYCDKVIPHFEVIRYHADKLELVVDNESWPLPKYREMLWIR